MSVVNGGTLCPGTRVTGGCEPCHVGPENQTSTMPNHESNQILFCKSIMCSELSLSYRSSRRTFIN